MDRSNTAYIVFDIETVPDGKLLAEVLYPGQELSEEQAISKQEQEVSEKTGGRSRFVPLTFQVPVAIAVARIAPDFTLQKAALLDAPEYRTRQMVELFWKGLQAYPDAALVDFGGRGFDLPVLELAAYKYAISCPSYYSTKEGKNYRHRYTHKHIDLLDWFTNHGAYRLKGGLDLMAKLLGKPGKLDVKGDMVLDLWREGRKDLIAAYCLCDVLDTYFVFIRSRVLYGDLSPKDELRLKENARSIVEDMAFDNPHLDKYLENWQKSPEENQSP